MREYKLGGTPKQSLCLLKDRLLDFGLGRSLKGLQREVEDYFSVKLPGIMEPEKG